MNYGFGRRQNLRYEGVCVMRGMRYEGVDCIQEDRNRGNSTA